MSKFINAGDGFYSLTGIGTIAGIVLIVVLITITALIKKEKNSQKTFSTKQLVFSAIAIALGFVTSYVKIFPMPWGGSVTLCSMMFITMIGYWFGPKVGITAAFAYGLLQFVQDGGTYILSPLQACMDYIFAFAALGVSGFFAEKKNGLYKGYVVAIILRGVFHTIGGYLYWMEYMPENFPKELAVIYPIAYNYAYILAEGAITLIVMNIPAVKKAFALIKKSTGE